MQNGMTVQLPKQDGATIKVAFQCGVSVRFILRYYNNTNQYELLIAYDPDDEKHAYRIKYLYDVHENGRNWCVHYDDYYYIDEHGLRYDVLAYVAENDDSYDIRVKLHKVKEYEE